MSIQFRCHHCSKRVQAPDSAGGKKARCPTCGQLTEVPLVKPDHREGEPFAGIDQFAGAHGQPKEQSQSRASSETFPAGGAFSGADVLPTSLARRPSPRRMVATPMQFAVTGAIALGVFVVVIVVASSVVENSESKTHTVSQSSRLNPRGDTSAPDASSGIAAGVIFVICSMLGFALYMLPSIIALSRQHQNIVPIFLINFFLAWTGIGWIACLAWAFSSHVTESRQYIRQVIVREPFDSNS